MSYVEIESLVKQYGDKTVLDDISLSVEKGEFITLLGQSGCGKSTLLRSIAGIADVDAGVIKVNGHDITHLPSRKRGIGMVFQSYALFPNMTVTQNISYGLKLKKKKGHIKIVQDMMAMMGLEELGDRYPHELSGGQQQRVALSRSLVMEPEVLLLDEPFSALDAKIRKALQQEIKNIQRKLNITTIFVTHDQKEAMILSDRIFVMNQGKIVQTGTPDEVYIQPRNKFIAGFMGSYNIIPLNMFKQWTNHAIHFEKDIAIRPESIMISQQEEEDKKEQAYHLTGKVVAKMVTGNILIYRVALPDQTIQIDTLYQYNEQFEEGEEVHIYIPIKACVQVS
ncbi:ABC transporter ATP-binding protein [Gracilibacillus alcaliphilus]|uniref:ABC transporter ATP-binding protein n=1 Tax=Gracilibacillus alcaliphilus TaxID=1401441 RepID=UPI00195A07AF|nr:ABC transporter ATP-binding protein [Gracilibacillus alcaliphilus]MBM7676531.1 putative spermidine/putrescine transport system ATP-binding protein [Gracilibacillus alcaliphilus]